MVLVLPLPELAGEEPQRARQRRRCIAGGQGRPLSRQEVRLFELQQLSVALAQVLAHVVDEVGELRAEIRKLSGTRTSSNLLKLLKDLALAKGDEVSAIYETELDGPEVRLKGEARSFQAANDFKGRAGKLFDGAEVSEIKSRPDGSVSFSLRGKLKGVTP